MDIKQTLEGYNVKVLKAMARINGINVGSTRKAVHVKALSRALYNKAAVEKALPRLSARERRALDLIVMFGGTTTSQRLKQALEREELIKERAKSTQRYGYQRPREGDPYRQDSPLFEDIVARLNCMGLIVNLGNPDSYSTVMGFVPGIRLVIPPQVMPHLPEVKLEEDTSVPEIDITTEASARTFQRDLYLYWSHIRDEPVRLTQKDFLYKRDLKKVNETLMVQGDMGKGMGEEENPRLHFVRLLLQQMNLLKVRRKQSTVSAMQAAAFWSESPPARVKTCFQSWVENLFWNELRHLPGISIQSWYEPPELSLVVAGRKKVLEHLKQLPVGEWVALERLVNRLRMTDYEFLFSREMPDQRRHYSYGYYSPGFDTPYAAYRNPLGWQFSPIQDEAQGWEAVEAQFIRHIITHPLHWMGLVDVGYAGPADKDGAAIKPVAYRVTEIGAWVLGLGSAPEIPTGEGRVIVQPNFQIFALDPISDQVLASLDQFAERVKAERAIEYRLTRQSVYAGQQSGWTAGRIIEYLEGSSDEPLPQNVTRTLKEWESLHRRIVIHRRTALAQTVSPEVMDQLLSDETLAAQVSRRLMPTVALLKSSKDAVIQLERSLQAGGLPPARTGRSFKSRGPCLTLTDEGQVVFAQKVPSIFLFETLGHLVEKSDGQWWITRESVQRAVNRGLGVDEILKALTDLHRGPVSPRAVQRIKAWGKFYGDARLETLTLIQFRDPAALHELAADPELSPYLRSFLPDQGLARVSAEHQDRVRHLLAERGVEIVGKLKGK